MHRSRFTLAGLMGLVVAAAVGMAALSHPTELWFNGLFSLAIGLNFAAISLEARGRTASIGYSICGWAYIILNFGPWFNTNGVPHPITDNLMEWGYGVFDPDVGLDRFWFRSIAHSLFDIAAGLAGWLLAWGLSRKSHDAPGSTISTTGHS
jgi:hypothetical protein